MKWEKVRLEDCCYSISDGDHQPPPKAQQGIPFVTISNINSMNQLDFSDTMFVPKEYYQSLDEKRKVRKGDVLYSVVGSFGIPVLIKEERPFVFQRHIAILRPKEDIVDSGFLFYTMLNRDFYAKADAVAIGAAQRTVSLGSLRNIKIDVPSLESQKHIADILAAYDDLIENNQKQIKLLEEAAQRLYKEWFVDLRFPGHENTKIVDGVPEEWRKFPLEEIAPVVTGKKDANYGDKGGNYPFFTCSQETITALGYSFDTSAVILAGNGDFNVKLYRGKFEAYQRTYVLAPFDHSNLFNLYFTVQDNMEALAKGASGSTIKFLTKGMLQKILVLTADKKVLDKFNDYEENIQQKVEALKKQVEDLTEIRNRLLPKLMSGEVEV